MQLKRLEIRNIRSHETTELAFAPGTTLLVGDVGAGKTSLLYAIEMALFGFAEVDAAYLVRHSAPFAEVRLTLAEGEHTFEFRRRFRRRSTRGKEVFQHESCAYAEDGSIRTYSPTELRQRAIELLGFPDNPSPRAHSDLWRWAVYIPQERMRAVLEQSASGRLETVRKALGLEQYRTAAENAQLVAAELGRRADHFESEARGLDYFSTELEAWRAERTRAQEELGGSVAEEARLGASLAQADAEVTRLTLAAARHQQAERELTESRDRSTRLRTALARLTEREGDLTRQRARLAEERSREDTLAAELEEVERTVSAQRRSRESVGAELAQQEEALAQLSTAEARRAAALEAMEALTQEREREAEGQSDLRRQQDDLERRLPDREPSSPVAEALDALDFALADSQRLLVAARAEVVRGEVNLHEIEELLGGGVCPRCHQPVKAQEFGPHREEAAEALGVARDRVGTLEQEHRRIERRRRDREQFERVHLDWAHLQAERESVSVRLEALVARDAELEARAVRLREGLEGLDSKLRELAPQRPRHEALVAESNRLGELIRVAEERRLGIARKFEAARARQVELPRVEDESSRVREEKVEHRAELDRLEARLTGLEAEMRTLNEVFPLLDAARRSKSESAADLERFHQRLGGLRRTLEESVRQLTRAEEGAERRRRLIDSAVRQRALAGWLNRPFRESLLSLEQRLLNRAQAEFDHGFRQFFRALVDEPSLAARCDASFSPEVEIGGEWTPPEALSGGERTALALAYRLALGRVVRQLGQLKLDTLVLDEPTDGFSPEQVLRMGELLEGLGLPQVVLVSHEGALASVADWVLRVRKEGGVSSVVPDPRALETSPAEPLPSVEVPKPTPRVRRPRRRSTLEESVSPAHSP